MIWSFGQRALNPGGERATSSRARFWAQRIPQLARFGESMNKHNCHESFWIPSSRMRFYHFAENGPTKIASLPISLFLSSFSLQEKTPERLGIF
jgi:hypothetical protein